MAIGFKPKFDNKNLRFLALPLTWDSFYSSRKIVFPLLNPNKAHGRIHPCNRWQSGNQKFLLSFSHKLHKDIVIHFPEKRKDLV